MKKNRKKADTYRFNGVWGIKPVLISDLEKEIQKLKAKLFDLQDTDDKKWVARWLARYTAELAKKREGLESRKLSRERSRKSRTPPDAETR